MSWKKNHARPRVDDDIARYIITYFPNPMNYAEKNAWTRLISTMKATKGKDNVAAQEATLLNSYWSKGLSNEDEVVRLARHGWWHFTRVAAARVLSEHSGEIDFNFCPKCARLARTP